MPAVKTSTFSAKRRHAAEPRTLTWPSPSADRESSAMGAASAPPPPELILRHLQESLGLGAERPEGQGRRAEELRLLV